MRRVLLLGGLIALFAAGQALPGPVEGPFVLRKTVPPNNSVNLVKDFKAGERTCVVVIGNGMSYLGLYAYDADGNCIARDDRADYPTRDDAAVEWYPPQAGRYTMEVRNLGAQKDAFSMAVH
jgi:hypothetical protein